MALKRATDGWITATAALTARSTATAHAGRCHRRRPVTSPPATALLRTAAPAPRRAAARRSPRLCRSAARRRQAVLLPRSSPDLDPIEHVFAKLKALLRKTDPRTIAVTWRQIGSLLDRFTA